MMKSTPYTCSFQKYKFLNLGSHLESRTFTRSIQLFFSWRYFHPMFFLVYTIIQTYVVFNLQRRFSYLFSLVGWSKLFYQWIGFLLKKIV